MNAARKSDTADRVGGVVYNLFSGLIAAWWLMLAEGSIGADLGWPTLSFWQCLIAVVGLSAVVQAGTASIWWRQR